MLSAKRIGIAQAETLTSSLKVMGVTRASARAVRHTRIYARPGPLWIAVLGWRSKGSKRQQPFDGSRGGQKYNSDTLPI